MPNTGGEFHHFGWNACSSALSPLTAHALLERCYLIIPGIRSSRIYIIDVKEPLDVSCHPLGLGSSPKPAVRVPCSEVCSVHATTKGNPACRPHLVPDLTVDT
jgi:56kDa selenium binding protein (SBP56)